MSKELDIDNDLEYILEGLPIPRIIMKALQSYIIKHRIGELQGISYIENEHGAIIITRNDGERDVSINERRAQLHDILSLQSQPNAKEDSNER